MVSAMEITPGYLVREDSSNTLHEAADFSGDLQGFVPKEQLNFGYSKKVYWVVPDLIGLEKGKRYYFGIDHPMVNFADFYHLRNGRVIKTVKTGICRPYDSREFPLAFYYFRMDDWEEGDRILFRLQNREGSLKGMIHVYDEAGFMRSVVRSDFLFFLFIGLCLFQFLYAWIRYGMNQSGLFFWYAGFLFWAVLHESINMAYITYLLPDWLYSHLYHYRLISAPPGFFFFTGLILEILEVQTLFGRKRYVFFRAIQICMIPFFILLFLPLPIYPHRFVLLAVFNLVFVLLLTAMVVTSVQAIRKGHKPAIYLLVAQGPFVLALVLYLFRNYGYLPHHPVFNWLAVYALMFELAITLFAINIYYHRLDELRFHFRESDDDNQIDNSEESRKYELLLAYFETHKPYLHGNLKISDLAEQMQVPAHQISKSINNVGSMHFFDFVNSFRVKHACTLLSDPVIMEKYTLETLAEECGFTNRTSFHNAFKRFMNCTPNEYRKARK